MSNQQAAVQPAAPNANEQVEANNAPANQGRMSTWEILKTMFFRMIFIYIIASLFHSFRAPSSGVEKGGQPPLPTGNLVPRGAPLDMYVYISEIEEMNSPKTEALLFWQEKGIFYGDWAAGPSGDGSYFLEGDIQLSENVQNNGSLFLHCYFTPAGSPAPDYPTSAHRIPGNSFPTFSKTVRLNKYKRRYFHKTANLLTGESAAPAELVRTADHPTAYEVVNHWHENLTINLVDDHSPWARGAIPPPLDQLVEFELGTNRYYPIIFFNDYWNLHEEYMPVNNTVKKVHLRLTMAPLSLFRLQMYAGQMMRNKWFALLGQDDVEESPEEQDSLKRAIIETNVYLLAVTIVVSVLHTIFEFLAFKNDIQFWRSRKSLEGLSVRSVFFNNFQTLIVLLYILDNDANMMIRISIFISLLIEMWKITKVVDISFDREHKILGLPRLVMKDKSTYVESSTREYDRLAFKYLSWALFPLLIGYAVYSLLYQEHKGWYSFVLSMLYGFLLTFGFISMTPQLFINYKMKSVAHLPWRMLTYKFLNTFIDDLFAFVIRMPTMYRIGCLRDDVIFIIYVYQRWIYPVDKTRVNEFGVSQEDLEQVNNNNQTGQAQLPAQEQNSLDSKKRN